MLCLCLCFCLCLCLSLSLLSLSFSLIVLHVCLPVWCVNQRPGSVFQTLTVRAGGAAFSRLGIHTHQRSHTAFVRIRHHHSQFVTFVVHAVSMYSGPRRQALHLRTLPQADPCGGRGCRHRKCRGGRWQRLVGNRRTDGGDHEGRDHHGHLKPDRRHCGGFP